MSPKRIAACSTVFALLGCGFGAMAAPGRWTAPPRGPRTTSATGSSDEAAAYDRAVAGRFDSLRTEYKDLTAPDLMRRLEVARAPEVTPSFDPTTVPYWKKIRDQLELTSEEQALYRRTGVVAVDHVQRYSMASAYLAIYRRDLPVLITTDSILHALHRSFDRLLVELETYSFTPALLHVLESAHDELGKVPPASLSAHPAARRSAQDVDLYLTVARNLLTENEEDRREKQRLLCEGLRSTRPSCSQVDPGEAKTELEVKSKLGQDALVKGVLAAIAALKPAKQPALYGRQDATIDWSQFAPRGHYTKTLELKRYFRAMMWLGRADTGFALAPTHAAFGRFDADRELSAAALLSWLVRESGQLEILEDIDRAIGFLVGASDSVAVRPMAAATEAAGVRAVTDLTGAAVAKKIRDQLRQVASGGQRIRSQMGARVPGGPEAPLPEIMQLFGQRFALDSFVFSKLVFDAIDFQGHSMERTMPTGLDMAAAFGNDEAVALLAPELTKWGYAANLMAARRIVEERPPSAWNATLYDIWLSALAKLDDVPAADAEMPQVMRGQAWQRKQLRTQLASWAELRHDTILYVKQSYTVGILCEYPTGYVEPYPQFYARLRLFAEEAGRRLAELKLVGANPGAVTFLGQFATTMRQLEDLAQKELSGRPFTADERTWVRETIQATTSSGGCGGPPIVTYTGWYPKLLYNSAPEVWEPTIADVHTDPNSGSVLEVGTGDVGFVVVAVDNRRDRAAYVGPAYSFYEFSSRERLTDEAWRSRVETAPPAHPEWTRPFQGTPKHRQLVPPKDAAPAQQRQGPPR